MKKSLLLILITVFLLVGCRVNKIEYKYGMNYRVEITTENLNRSSDSPIRIAPGTYFFSLYGKPETAGAYKLYISTEKLEKTDEVYALGEPDYIIGGLDMIEATIELYEGDFLYILPDQDIDYEPTGWLNLKVIE